jgi:adenylate cyclase
MSRLANIKQHATRYAMGVIIMAILLAHVSGWMPIAFLKQMELDSYDARLNVLMPGGLDTRVVIVDIDEKSLNEQGRWPWGRDKLASLVDKLFVDYQISTLGFDVVFAEKDESSGYKALRRLQQTHFRDNPAFTQALAEIKDDLDYDQRFANSLQGKNVVLGYYFSNNALEKSGMLPAPNLAKSALSGKPIRAPQFAGFGANLGLIQQHAKAAGHFNPIVDTDGMSRKISMLSQYQEGYYESLSLAVARVALGDSTITPGFAQRGVSKSYAGLEWLTIGKHRVPVDSEVAALIPYRGPQGSFVYVSATDVLNGKISPNLLKHKIVLVGTTAAGLMDLRATPVQNVYAGVEIHANMIAGILDGNIKHKPAYTQGLEFVLLLAIGLLWIFLLPKLNPLKASVLTLALLLGLVILNLLIWQYADLVLPLATSLMLVLLLFVSNMSYGFFVESRGKRHLTKLFGQYIPPELVSEMAESDEQLNLTGESREMTVLFSDVRGFTTIAESMQPHDLTQLMNQFLSAMTLAIQENRGTIDKYMGDAVMAFWGAPLHDTQHASHAIAAAMAMQKALDDVNKTFKQYGWPSLEIGVGISTGLMTVGNMGSNFRMAYTVMGDAVNLGARLEGLTKEYGVPIVVSAATKAKAPEYLYQELDTVRVKGKDIPVTFFAPVCLLSEAKQTLKDEIALHHVALKYYYQQQWDLAELQWLNLQQQHGQKSLYTKYLRLISLKKKL